jgi:Tol biopolymer transport system component
MRTTRDCPGTAAEILFTDQTGQSGVQYSVYVRKRDGSPAVRIGENGFGADITPDGKFALLVKADDPQMRMQIVPVGTGEKRVLHWEGVQPIWAEWHPDGEHILLYASSPPGKPSGIYVTDIHGMPPKLIVERAFGRAGVSPDGAWISCQHDGKILLQSTTNGESKELANLPGELKPIAWGSDAQHLFTQKSETYGVTLARVDLKTGKVEPWQTIKPKDQIGLRWMVSPVAITPDGKWMAYAYGNELDQLYVSDGLK